MERFDPSAHADYLITALLVAFALERLLAEPRTVAMQRAVGAVRHLEAAAQARFTWLRARRKVWTEAVLLAGALLVRVLAFFLVEAVRALA